MRRVVKIGGSLLLRDDLPTALPRWLASQPESENLVVVGGGELIDAIRRLDRVHPGDPIETHWLCVELLETTRRLLSQWLDWPSVCSPETLVEATEKGFPRNVPTLVSVQAFYNRHGVGEGIATVPLDWRTTTDTIAALLAIQTGTDELVLLKQCNVDSRANIGQLARDGIVDEALTLVESKVKSIRVEQLDAAAFTL